MPPARKKRPPAKRAPSKRAPAKRAAAKRSPSKRAAAKRSPSKRAPAKRAPAKRAPAKRAPAKRAASKGSAAKPTRKKNAWTPAAAAGAAKRRFRIDTLHPEQARGLNHLAAAESLLAVLPTGFGKSLLFQLPAVLLARPVVVVSPLIALMRDQERHLQRAKIPVARIDSTLKAQERRDALAKVAGGGTLVVLTTPETLWQPPLQKALKAAKPALFCVDEAHCVSEWGHDFRPAYLRLAAAQKALRIPQALALTATATPQVRKDIKARLGLDTAAEIVASPRRSNLRLAVHLAGGNLKIERAGRILKRLQRPGIVYCATTKAVDEIYGALVRARIPASRYHGGMKKADREASQKKFMRRGRRSVMVATSAFGMGIDKKNIRYIAHYQVPGSLEQYVQEAGRAGRDGRRADCILLFDAADLEIQRFLQKKGRPNGGQLRRVTDALLAWCRDKKAVAVKDLALSARVPQTVCKAMLGEMEHAGLVHIEGRAGDVTAKVSLTALKRGATQLVAGFERQAFEDTRRLAAMAGYAETEACRNAYIAAWFGEPGNAGALAGESAQCGHCDICRPAQERPRKRGSDSGRKRRAPGRHGPGRRKRASRAAQNNRKGPSRAGTPSGRARPKKRPSVKSSRPSPRR